MNKTVRAFLTAALLFLATAAAGHLFAAGRVRLNNPAFSFWSREEKSMNLEGLAENMNAGSIPVFGSSEFQHGTDTPFHPSAVFADTQFDPMLIGAGYYQSLSHAITLAAIEPYLQAKKAVLIVSPQWFRKTGVVDQAFASRFSETLYSGMLDNSALPQTTRDALQKRTLDLMQIDPKMRERLVRHEDVLQGGAQLFDVVSDRLHGAFLKEKDRYMLAAGTLADGIAKGEGLPQTPREPDWEALLALAEESGKQENQNRFYIREDAYQKLEPYLPQKENRNADAKKGYQTGPEFDDLRLFLTVCNDLGITPMLVLMPVNGYYYDYTGFPASARAAYYDKVRGIAQEFGAQTADFTDQEYTKYFFEDRVHLGQKGWVMVNESLYRFFLQ